MATSGTYGFVLTVGGIIEEACERAGVEQTAPRARSARRSLALLMMGWSNDAIGQWRVEQKQQLLTAGLATYTLESQAIDILDMVLRRDVTETPIEGIGRSDYLMIPRKDQQGRPDRFFVDRGRDSVTFTLWQTPENSTDIVIFNQFRRHQDVTTNEENIDVDRLWYDAVADELAARMAFKFNTPKYMACKAAARESYFLARTENRERADTVMRVRYGRR